jgi:hypothetical protein
MAASTAIRMMTASISTKVNPENLLNTPPKAQHGEISRFLRNRDQQLLQSNPYLHFPVNEKFKLITRAFAH